MRLSNLNVCILILLLTSAVFAQTTDISGRYEGAADIAGLGKINIKGEIRQKVDKISGIFNTPLGDAPIIEGNYKDGSVTLTLDAGGDDLFLKGKITPDGKIVGEVSGATAKGTFELMRTGDVAPEVNNEIILQQSKEKWLEDLRFLADELPKKHKNAFHQISRGQFDKMVGDLETKIPTLSDTEIFFGLRRIVASIGDGHTGLGWSQEFTRVPMNLFWFGKELRVTKISKQYPRANGARLIKIGGVPVETIYEQCREYISQGESEQFVLDVSGYLLTMPAFLKTLGLTKKNDKAIYEFVDLKGKRFSLEMNGERQNEEAGWIVPIKSVPLYLQNPGEPFFFEYLKDAKTVYVNFKWYPRRAQFRKFSNELFDFIDKTAVDKIVFDLRQNGGGDFTRGRDFFIKPLKERKTFLDRGRLFVITGRKTFSAGMTNSADFRNDLKAILVGEPTGARPNGYQENRGFILPNSHLPVSYSIQFYKFSETDTPGILPDKRIDPEWKSYLAGRDTALEWILAYPNGSK